MLHRCLNKNTTTKTLMTLGLSILGSCVANASITIRGGGGKSFSSAKFGISAYEADGNPGDTNQLVGSESMHRDRFNYVGNVSIGYEWLLGLATIGLDVGFSQSEFGSELQTSSDYLSGALVPVPVGVTVKAKPKITTQTVPLFLTLGLGDATGLRGNIGFGVAWVRQKVTVNDELLYDGVVIPITPGKVTVTKSQTRPYAMANVEYRFANKVGVGVMYDHTFGASSMSSVDKKWGYQIMSNSSIQFNVSYTFD